MNEEHGKFRVRSERCPTCLYAVRYPKATRDRILGEVARNDSYVQCHGHDGAAHVCCRGYWDAVGDGGGTSVQIAWRLDRLGLDVVEWVPPGAYPPDDEDGGADDNGET